MLLPRKLIILAIIIHVVTIIACASLQPDEEGKNKNEQKIEQQEQMKQADEDQSNEETILLEQ